MSQTRVVNVQSAPPASVATDPASVELSVLQAKEVVVVSQIADMQADAASSRATRASGPAAERTRAQSDINSIESALVGKRAELAQVRARMAELQTSHAIPTPPAPPSFAYSIPQEHVFGMTHEEVKVGSTFLFAFPMVVALSVLIWRRAMRGPARPPLVDDRIARIEQAVEAVAIEVERIGESQRYQAKLAADERVERVRIES